MKDARVADGPDGRRSELILSFGDKVPYEFVEEVQAVGNSANAAVCATRLGLNSAFVTDLGDYHQGYECRSTLQKNKVATDFITVHKDKKTNYHYVLWFEDDRTILIKHEHYDYKFPDIGEPKWVYLTSIGENSLDYHKEIIEYLRNHPDIRLAFQPGTFQIKMGVEGLREIYARADVFFCNVEEAKRILNMPNEQDIKNLLKEMHRAGPNVVAITDGVKGAYAYDGYEGFFMRPYPDEKPPYDRTGAGDAFSATFTSALALGKSLRCFPLGPINSMSVVQKNWRSGRSTYSEEILKFLTKAPKDYFPQKIM